MTFPYARRSERSKQRHRARVAVWCARRCECGHPYNRHAAGVGCCYGSARRGTLCGCEGFKEAA